MATSRDGVYIIIDAEFVDVGTWLSLCFMTARYPSGQLVSVEEFYVDRTKHEIKCPNKRLFWQKHADAFDYNLKRGAGISEEVAERSVCEYLKELRLRNPHFFLVSDNPAMDVGICDAILAKFGCEPLSQRAPNVYAQVLCTWSYKQSLARIFQVRTATLFQHPMVIALLEQHKPRAVPSSTRTLKNATDLRLPHTVLRDCSTTLATFFRCLDLTNALSHFLRMQCAPFAPGYSQTPMPLYVPAFVPAIIPLP